MTVETPIRQRLDKWLWHARVTKTRTLAQKLIEAGAVRLNGQRITAPDQKIRPGDGLTLQIHSRIKVLRVIAIADRRGPASIAVSLYEDISPSLEKPDS